MTKPESRHVGDRLPLYVAGQVSPEERSTIELHLNSCAACRQELSLWQSLPDALAKITAVPSSATNSATTWSKLAPRLVDHFRDDKGTPAMSYAPELPPQKPVQSRLVPANRPNTWIAVVIAVGVIVLMIGFIARLNGRAPQSSVGSPPTPHVTATTVSPDVVTQNDAEALFNGFLLACHDPATYHFAGQGVPCPKLGRGLIPMIVTTGMIIPPGIPHYCVVDWHLVSVFDYDTQTNLQSFMPQMTLDGTSLQVMKTPIKLVDPTYSQQYLGGQYYYIHVGTILSPQSLAVGQHELHQFASGGFDRHYTFTVDAAGTGACVNSVIPTGTATPGSTPTPPATVTPGPTPASPATTPGPTPTLPSTKLRYLSMDRRGLSGAQDCQRRYVPNQLRVRFHASAAAAGL